MAEVRKFSATFRLSPSSSPSFPRGKSRPQLNRPDLWTTPMKYAQGVWLLAGLLVGCAGLGRSAEDATAKARLDGLADDFRNRKVASVEVLHIPTEILFRSAVTPE